MNISRFAWQRKAWVASIALSVLFIVVYSGCLWVTARRSHVGVLYFQWERTIPFLPSMILPYLSIDLFFVVAPFLLPNEQELWLFVRRVSAAILVAGLFFLVFPLRFAFPRPAAPGWLGVLFNSFRALDAPYNLFPSLHAALLALLTPVYARHLEGVWRAVVLLWFALIAASPLLTRQHHVIDIVGGFALAVACFTFIRAKNPSPARARKRHDDASRP